MSSETVFKTQVAVHQWLLDNGWKISLSQFNKHCKDSLLRRGKDGNYHLRDIEKYATLRAKRADTGQKTDEFEEKVRREKLEISLQRERISLEKEQHEQNKRQGKYIAKEDFEMAIVARAVTFMAHLNHSIHSNVLDWIDVAEGNPQRAAELVDAINKIIEQRMGDFAVDAEFDVILEANC